MKCQAKLILACVLAVAGCRDSERSSPVAQVEVTTSEPSTCVVTIPETQHRGMCFAHNWQDDGVRGYGSEVGQRSIEELASLGIDSISITPFGWQRGLDSTEIHMATFAAAETDDRLASVVEQAHDVGMRVMMKPHIWISHTDWRGHIRPSGADGWSTWFASYETFILHYADLSERIGADALVVGVELASSTREHPERWRDLIAEVRRHYSGSLVYAANWDEAEHVIFWDAVDYIGVQMFAPLSERVDPTVEELETGARHYLERYRALSEQSGRPLILTEVGFKSIPGTAISPYTWPEHLGEDAVVVDEQAQVDAYCAILSTFGQSEDVAAIYWWKWFSDPATDEEDERGFSPRGKAAESLLRAAYVR